MSEPIYYELKVDWNYDFLLRHAIQRDMMYLWERSCFMASHIDRNEHYYALEIDHLADYLLQIDNHK